MFEAPQSLTSDGFFLNVVGKTPDEQSQTFYSIEAGPDLFGAIVIRTEWGRAGARPRRKSVSFDTEASALTYIAKALSRRRSAAKRNGIVYILASS